MGWTVLDAGDEKLLRAAYALRVAAASHDLPGEPQPCWYQFAGRVQLPRSGFHQQIRVLAEGSELVGGYRLELPMLENLDAAVLELAVAPDQRCRGTGRKLLEHAARAARQEGRQRLVMDSHSPLHPEPESETASFLRAVGAKPVAAVTWYRLHYERMDEHEYGRMLEDARERSARYETVSWIDEAPDSDQQDMAVLMGYALSGQPSDSLDWRPAPWTVDRLAGYDRLMRTCRTTRFTTAARDRESGALVGETTLALTHTPRTHATQCETIVAPPHRGHGLGIRLKLENLRFALTSEPLLKLIDTLVADSNGPMIDINRPLGFHPHRTFIRWQLELPR